MRDTVEIEGPCAVLRRDSSIVAWSQELERLTGWTSAEVVGRSLVDFLVPLDPVELPDLDSAEVGECWQGSVALTAQGVSTPLICDAQILVGQSGEVRLGLGLRELRAAVPTSGQKVDVAQRLDAVLGHLPGFCYTVDTNLVFTSSEGAGLANIQVAPGQLVGRKLTELWGTEDPTYEPMHCHLKALAGIPQAYRDVCLGRSLEYQIRPLYDESGAVAGVIGVGMDVTEREQSKEIEARLTAKLRQAQKMESVGQLAGGVAHDFNNFLTCIMGNLALAQHRLDPDSPVARRLVDANAAVESAASLTRQLLAFSRKQVIEPRPINLSALIQKIEGMLVRLIGDRVVLRTQCLEDLGYVQADPGQMEQVLVNLVVNARDAITGPGEIVVETLNRTLEGECERLTNPLEPGAYVVLSVRDTGCGISDAVRAKLFEPFFTTKGMGEGTGLGLATVYGAVQQNGGAISVESVLGRGATFQVYLPRIEVDASVVRALGETVVIPSNGAPRGTETILLVEDEPSVLELADCTLEQLGYRVLACSTADEALRVFAAHQQQVDLLVTDVVMPRMNGKELAARVSSLNPEISVLYTSGYGENIIAKRGVIDPGVHFMAKPYRPGELAQKVRDVLDLRARRRQPEESPSRRGAQLRA